ncbi:HNH endonuclease signature motif containing protein [Modestobacter marinus]|uniref:HNH endonuclease signature motif containing protein n=1 Tax=Modestobacter marinus TaxID=477641 RepID=UPI001C962A65|nr:HNH endonuclease signature motif containing protein [Modestobacter marinus]
MDDGTGAAPTVERPLAELAQEITSGAVRLAAATAAWLVLVAEFDRRQGWAGIGITSCAHWLAWQCGLSPGAAREHVRVARALTGLPVTATAFADGRLSYSKVRELTRVADAATETELVELAGQTTASQLARVVRAWRRSDAVDDDVVTEKRAFRWSWGDDGMLTLQVRVDAEEGAALLAAIESLAERDARRERAAAKRAAAARRAAAPGSGDTRDGAPDAFPPECADPHAFPRERMTARRCRAMVQLAGAAPAADRRAGDPPRREVVVHVDADVLADDAAAGRAHLEGGPALHPSVVRRMACEAALTVIVERNGQPLALGRRARLATQAQRRALLARDGGCVRPGCTEDRIERLHAHHLRRWAFGGRTDVSTMVLLCDVDHGLVHDRELVMSRRGGQLIVLTPEGQRIWGSADAAFPAGLDGEPTDGSLAGVHPIDQLRGRRPSSPGSAHTATGGTVTPLPTTPRRASSGRSVTDALHPLLPADPATGLPDSLSASGERMDLGHVVWVLLAHRDRLRRQSA